MNAETREALEGRLKIAYTAITGVPCMEGDGNCLVCVTRKAVEQALSLIAAENPARTAPEKRTANGPDHRKQP